MQWPLDTPQTLTTAVALGGAITSAFFALRNFRLSFITARQKYFDEIRKWADDLSDALTEAIFLCELDPKKTEGESFFNRRHRLRIVLSSMIDRGRWFFPNIEIGNFGANKGIAYRGYRHEILDSIVAAFYSVQQIDYRNMENNRSVQADLIQLKRNFVGQIQELLDPAKRRAEFDRVSALTRGSRRMMRE